MDPIKLTAIACSAYESNLRDDTFTNDYVKLAMEGLLGPPEYIHCKGYDIEAYVLKYPGHVVFAIRGTDSFVDMCEDAKLCLTPWENSATAKVHSGFNEQFKAMEDELLKIHSEVISMTPTVEITCVGHSSGAALACLLATKISAQNYIGFGSPKIGNVAFAKLHQSRCIASHEYVNGADVITQLPGGDYVHPAAQIHIGKRSFSLGTSINGLNDHCSNAYWLAMQGQDQTFRQYLAEMWEFVCRLFCCTK